MANNTYELEIKDLCNRLAKVGYTPVEVWQDYEESYTSPTYEEACSRIMEVDCAQLTIDRAGTEHTIQIILGNGPGEAVNDYTYTSKDEESNDLLDKVTSEHYAYWDGGAVDIDLTQVTKED